MGQAESQYTFLGEDRPLADVAADMDRVAVRQRKRRTGDLNSGRGPGDDTTGGYHTDCARIVLNIEGHIDCIASGAGHMGSLWWVG